MNLLSPCSVSSAVSRYLRQNNNRGAICINTDKSIRGRSKPGTFWKLACWEWRDNRESGWWGRTGNFRWSQVESSVADRYRGEGAYRGQRNEAGSEGPCPVVIEETLWHCHCYPGREKELRWLVAWRVIRGRWKPEVIKGQMNPGPPGYLSPLAGLSVENCVVSSPIPDLLVWGHHLKRSSGVLFHISK